jgi:sigma-E factor negative regulatory protein RseB
MAPGWRIASLAAIVGLLGSGLAALALTDMPTALPAAKAPGLGGSLLRLARPPRTARTSAGLRLLQEAAVAGQDISYRGVQVVMWWGQRETSASVVEVWHQQGGATLVQASGTTPGQLAGIPQSAAASDLGPDGILAVSGRLLTLLQSNYQVVYTGRGSADNRDALVVEVRRPDGGLAARFWLDAATKLPLRRELFDASARMISEDAFINLELGTGGLGGMPAAAAAPWTAQLDPAALAALGARGWPVPGQLPGNLVLFAATQTSTRSGPVVDLSYSDGLAVVSLFVQRGQLAHPMTGWQPVVVHGRTVYSADPDEICLSWSAGEFVYTLIADAPMTTVSQVVAALPATTRLGIWQRMARGLHRLASWANPLR